MGRSGKLLAPIRAIDPTVCWTQMLLRRLIYMYCSSLVMLGLGKLKSGRGRKISKASDERVGIAP